MHPSKQPQSFEVVQDNKNNPVKHILSGNTPQTIIGNRIVSSPSPAGFATKKMLMNPSQFQPQQQIIIPRQSPSSGVLGIHPQPPPSPISRRIQQQQVGAQFNRIIKGPIQSGNQVMTRNSLQYLPGTIPNQIAQQQQAITQITQPYQQPVLPGQKISSNPNNNKVTFRRASVSFLPEQSPNSLRQQQQFNPQLPQAIAKQGFITNPNENNNLAIQKAVMQQRQQQQQGQTIIPIQPQIIQEQLNQPIQLASQQGQQQQIHTKLLQQQPQQLVQQKQQQPKIIEGQPQQQQQPVKILVQPAPQQQHQVQQQFIKQQENNQNITNQIHQVPDQVFEQQNQIVITQQQQPNQPKVIHLQQQQQQQHQQPLQDHSNPSDTTQQQHQLLLQLQHINEQLTVLKNNYESQLNQRRISGEYFGDIKEQFNHNLIAIYSQAKKLPLQYQQILLVTVLLPSGESGIPRSKQGNNIEVQINQLITTIEQAYINNIVANTHTAISPVNEPMQINQQTSLIPITIQEQTVGKLTRVKSENFQQFASNYEKFQNYETQLGSASARKEENEGLVQYSPIVRAYPRFQQEKYAMDSAQRAATQGDIFVFRGNMNQELEFTLNNHNNLATVPNGDIQQQPQEEEQPIKRALLEAFATATQLQQQQQQQQQLQQQQQQPQQIYETIQQPFTKNGQSGFYTQQNQHQHQEAQQQYILNLPQQPLQQQPKNIPSTDFNIVTTHGSYQIPPPPVALPPYQPLFSKELSNNPHSHNIELISQAPRNVSQFQNTNNQFEIKTTSKDLTKLLSEAKYAEVSEYAYHTLSEIDMQLIHIKSTIERALEEADMPNTKQLLAEVIESLRQTVKTQEIDISQKAINKLQKNTQRLLHDKTASYELYLYLQKLTSFLQERENILNQSYQANNEMRLLSQSQADEFFNDSKSNHDGSSSSNGIITNPSTSVNNFIIKGQQGQQQQQQQSVKLSELFKKQDNKTHELDVPEYVPIKEHLRRQGSWMQQLEQKQNLSHNQHSKSVNSFVGENTDKFSKSLNENLYEQNKLYENEDIYLELRKRAAKAGRDEAIRRSSSSFSGRPSIDRREQNSQGIQRDSMEGAVQNAIVIEGNSGSRFSSVQPNRNSESNNNNYYTISNRQYEQGADNIVQSNNINNNNNNNTKSSLADIYAISSNSRKSSLHNNNNNSQGANPPNISAPAVTNIQGQNTFQPDVQYNTYTYDDKLAVSFNPKFAKYQNITSINSNFNDSQRNKTYDNQMYFNPPPRQQLQQQSLQQSPSNSFAVIDNESSPKIDFFMAEEDYPISGNDRGQRSSQDPELLQKMKFYELAIEAKSQFPKSHPAHDHLITSLWEGASSIPESSWRAYINQKLNEKK